MPSPINPPHPAAKIANMLDPQHELCREDIVCFLDYVKNQLDTREQTLLQLPNWRILKNFRAFASMALLLIHAKGTHDEDRGRIRECMAEAGFGLLPHTGRDSD